jgi:dTMP kinase
VIFLSLSSEEAARRGGFGEERYEKEEMQRKVRELFARLQAEERDRGDWRVVDASGDVEHVGERIWQVVEPVLESVGDSEIRSIS